VIAVPTEKRFRFLPIHRPISKFARCEGGEGSEVTSRATSRRLKETPDPYPFRIAPVLEVADFCRRLRLGVERMPAAGGWAFVDF
jgi:hypothetical protein